MTFKDLLEQFSFDEIAPAFKTLWQRNAPEQARCIPLTISVWGIVGRVAYQWWT